MPFHTEWHRARSTNWSKPGDKSCREPAERCERSWLSGDSGLSHIRYKDRSRMSADRRSWALFALQFGNWSAARNYMSVPQPDTEPNKPEHRSRPSFPPGTNSRASADPKTHTPATRLGQLARSPPLRNRPAKSFVFLYSPFLFLSTSRENACEVPPLEQYAPSGKLDSITTASARKKNGQCLQVIRTRFYRHVNKRFCPTRSLGRTFLP